MKKFLSEFKEFALRGNVLDMAIGVVIGGAFGKITTSLVNDVIMPLVGLLIGGIDLGQLDIVLKPAVMNGDEVVTAAVTLGIGTFLTTIIDFILVALVIFLMIKAINRFHNDTEECLDLIRKHCEEIGVKVAMSEVFAKGGEGGIELANAVVDVLENTEADYKPLYDLESPVTEKIEAIATKIYGASGVVYSAKAKKAIANIEENGLGNLPICIAKTQASISDNPKLKGAPTGWELNVREVYVSGGAGFIVPVCGDMMLMPGLANVPAAMGIDMDADGNIVGLK